MRSSTAALLKCCILGRFTLNQEVYPLRPGSVAVIPTGVSEDRVARIVGDKPGSGMVVVEVRLPMVVRGVVVLPIWSGFKGQGGRGCPDGGPVNGGKSAISQR